MVHRYAHGCGWAEIFLQNEGMGCHVGKKMLQRKNQIFVRSMMEKKPPSSKRSLHKTYSFTQILGITVVFSVISSEDRSV